MSVRAILHIHCAPCGQETLHNACVCTVCGNRYVKPSIKLAQAGDRAKAGLTVRQRALRPAYRKLRSVKRMVKTLRRPRGES